MKPHTPCAGKWRVLSGVSASMLAFFIGGMSIANANAGWMNAALSTPNQKMVNDSGQTPYYFESDYASLSEMLEAKNDLLERISEEGSVLLKNDGQTLPLEKGTKVTLLGYGSFDPVYGGFIGSSITQGGTQNIVSLSQALEERGFSVNPAMTEFYQNNPASRSYSGFMFGSRYENLEDAVIGEVPVSAMVEKGIASASDNAAALTAETIADYDDAGIVVITRASSEAAQYNINASKTPDGDSYDSPLDLTEYEKGVIDLAANSFDKVIVLLNSDQALGIDSIKNNPKVSAILWTGLPGAKGFYGVADILNGDANPSGHLPDTFAVHPASAPANANMGLYTWANASVNGGSEKTGADYGKSDWYLVENEGIYVGYKYYETRYADALFGDAEARNNANATEYVKSYADYSTSSPWSYEDQVSYSFGYGLSYNTCVQTLNSVTIDPSLGSGNASVTVTNTNHTAGKAAIQLYVQAPYQKGGVEKSAIQLVDFEKVSVPAGESVTAELTFDLANFASFDEQAGKWILDAGDYIFAVGNGAHEALNNILAAAGTDTSLLVQATSEETLHADAVQTTAIGDLSGFLTAMNENVENRLTQADYRTYDNSYSYITRSDWSKGWETVGTWNGKGEDAVSYTEDMQPGLFAELYTIGENEKTDDMNFSWDTGDGLNATDFIGISLDGTISKNGNEYSFDDLVNCMSLYEACFLLENEYQNLDPVSSIGLGECVTNDGPAGFAYDQVPGYAYNWQLYETYDKNYVAPDDENAKTSMAVYNTEPIVAATFNKELAAEQGFFFGEDSLWADENCIIGPGVNLHRSAYNARNHEYYSEDSVLTSLMAVSVCKGGYEKGLMMEPKHFAFNHQEVNRTGTVTFFSEQAGRENELRCFQGMMEGNYCQSLMTAFNRIGTEFAGACPEALIGIARDEWGFEGMVVTDMVNGAMYMNWRDTFAYGLSGCLGTNAYEATPLGASTSDANQMLIAKDSWLQQQIHDAVKYVVYQEVNSNFMNGMDETTRWEAVTPWWQTALTACTVLFCAATVLTLWLYIREMLSFQSLKNKVQTGDM